MTTSPVRQSSPATRIRRTRSYAMQWPVARAAVPASAIPDGLPVVVVPVVVLETTLMVFPFPMTSGLTIRIG